MNGQEMMLNAAMKLMGITPESVQATLGELKQIGAIAREFRDRMARMEAKQDRILELLEAQNLMTTSNGFDHPAEPNGLLIEQQTEERSNGY